MMHAQVLTFCRQTAVLPVLSLDDEKAATDIAAALLSGGLPVLEITLRSKNAPAVLAAVAAALPQAIVGAGSILNVEQLRIAKDCGARFAVSPGASDELLDADVLPLLPGAQTASEIMRVSAQGFNFVKFFPAASSGGIAALAAFAGPLPQVFFCPTGGIDEASAADYLALPNVVCVGGSWLVASGDDTDSINRKARAAARLFAR